MNIKFDRFKVAREPNIVLCNPSGDELHMLSGISERQLTLRYSNNISEFSFTAIDRNKEGDIYPYFDLLQTTRVVKIQDIAEFVITNVIEVDNGVYKSKDVSCKSVEFDISQKGISIDDGTYKFYDSVNPDNTIMGFIMEMLPDWELGSIDSDLWNLFRTFKVTEKNIYDFMISDVEEAFECIFIFDTVGRTISAKSIKNAVTETDIFLSHKNVVKNLDVTEDAEEIKTALNVYGADDINIRSVNPMGGTTLYNFDYYKNIEWMPQDLIDAINVWENKVKSSNVQQTNTLSEIKKANGELLSLNTQLTELKGQLKSLENIKAVRLEAGLDIKDINKQITDKQTEIDGKESQVKTKEEELKTLKSQLNTVSEKLALVNNFTKEQYKVLTKFIKVGTYQNDTFVVTDSMTEVEKQTILEELMQVGQEVLGRVSQPKYSFNMEATNFLNMIDFKKVSSELELGSQITIGMNNKHKFAYPVLLELQVNYDNKNDITLGFGNSLRLDKSEFTLAELFKEASSVSSDVSFNKGKWSEGIKAKNQFNDYLNSSLNASLQEIISSDYQDILIDGSGIRCRRFNPNTNKFDPEQLWITGKSMVFSDDGFQTAKTALGRIKLPDGTYGYGINSEVVLGKLIAGGQLIIENEGGTFKVDGDGVTLINAKLIIRNETTGKDTTVKDEIDRVDQAVEDAKNEASGNLGNAIDDINGAINQAKDELSGNLASAIEKVVQDIKAVEDGVVDIFYNETQPTGAKHGDLWFNTSKVGGNKLHRYNENTGKWEEIQDKDIISAIDKAQNAQSTADGKISTYLQDTPPKDGDIVNGKTIQLGEGDLWVDTTNGSMKLHRYSVSNKSWMLVRDKGIDEVSSKLEGAISDINGRFDNMDQAIADGMIETFYQKEQPQGKIGDLWYNTSTGKLRRYDGVQWQLIEDAKIEEAIKDAQNAQTTADGKITTYYQNDPPTGTSNKPIGEGDLWIDLNDGNKLYRYSKSSNSWITVRDKGIDKVAGDLATSIGKVYEDMDSMKQAIEDGVIDIYYQTTQPSNAKIGDLWVDTDDNKFWRYDGNTWVGIQDKDIQEALDKAQNAQSTADGKISTYYNANPPTGTINKPLTDGDLWVDTDNDNKLHRYDAQQKKWIPVEYNGVNDSVQEALNQKVTTYYDRVAPSKPNIGDLWFDTSIVQGNTTKNKLHRWSGTAWIAITDSQIIDAIDKAQNAQDTADRKIVTYSQPTQPVGLTTKDVGDLWIDTDDNNKMWRWNGSAWADISYQGMNNTVSSKLQEALDKIKGVEDIVDGKVEIFYGSTPPSSSTVAQGDLWIDTTKNIFKRWNNGAWENIKDKDIETILGQVGNLEDAVDGKITTYYQNDMPTSPHSGDLWIDMDNNNRTHRWNGISWIDITLNVDNMTSGNIQNALNKAQEALDKANQADAKADGAVDIYYQATEPTTKKMGDLWVNTTNNRLHIWENAWKEIKDKAITDAMIEAGKAMDKADSKIRTFYQVNMPVDGEKGDIWFDTSRGNLMHLHNGSTFVLVRDEALNTVINNTDKFLNNYYDAFFDYGTEFWSKNYDGQFVESANVGESVIDGVYGGRAIKITGEQVLYSKNGIPLDYKKKYKFCLRVKQLTHAKTDKPLSSHFEKTIHNLSDTNLWDLTWFNSNEMNVYIGIVCLDKHYKSLGAPKYVTAKLLAVDNNWVELEASVLSTGSTNANFYPNTAYIRPAFRVNAPNGVGTVLVDSLFMEDVSELQKLEDKVSQDLGNALTELDKTLDSMGGKIDGVVEIFYHPSQAPTTAKVGDLWFNTTTNEVHMFNGTRWESIQDKSIIEAISKADVAQNTADGKISTYYQPTEPRDGQIVDGKPIKLGHGDLWVNIGEGNKLYRYDKNSTLADWSTVLEHYTSWGGVASNDRIWNDIKNISGSSGSWIPIQDASIGDIKDKVDNIVTPDGNVDTGKLEGHINATLNTMKSANSKLIFDGSGIKALDNIVEANATNVVWMNDGGLMFSNRKENGVRVWETAIDAKGITANAIKTGTLSAIDIFGANIELETKNKKNKISINPSSGIKIQKYKANNELVDMFHVDAYGDAIFKGKLIGNEINVNDNFVVDTSGNVTATSITISGQSTLDAKDMVVRNLVVGGNVTMGANATISWGQVASKPNVATQDDLDWNNLANKPIIPKVPNYITSTKITQTTIESPDIIGGTITGGTLHQVSSGINYADIDIMGGYLQWMKGGTFYGSISVDGTSEHKMYIQGGKALKLETASGGISIQASSGNRVHIGDCQFMGSVSGCRVVFG